MRPAGKLLSAVALALVASLAAPLPARADAPAAAAAVDDDKLDKEIERLYDEGKYDEALAKAEELVQSRESRLGKEHPRTASALSDLGAMYLTKGDYVKAEPLLRRAVEILDKSKGSEDLLATALGNLGAMFRRKGDMKNAEALYKRALDLNEKGGPTREVSVGVSLNQLAGLYMATGKLKEAERLLLRAVDIHERLKEERRLLVDLGNLGALYRGMGQYHLAVDQYNKALPITENVLGREHPDSAKIHVQIGVLLTGDNRADEADEHFKHAVPILIKGIGPWHPDLAQVYMEWAISRTSVGDVERALSYWEKAEAIVDRFLDNVLAVGTEEEKIRYAQQLERMMDYLVSFQYGKNMGSKEATRFILRTVLRQKGRVLDATAAGIGALRSRLSKDDQRLLDELMRVRGELSRVLTLGPRGKTVDEFVAQTNKLGEEADRIEAKISEIGARLGKKKKTPVTVEAVQARIPKDAALLEYVQYTPMNVHSYSAYNERAREDEYMLYVLTSDGEPQWVPVQTSAKTVEDHVRTIRNGIMSPPETRFYDVAALLQNNLFFGGVLDRLKKKGIKHLLISPDSTLSIVPFAALKQYNGRFLLQDFEITYLSSGRDLLRLEELRQSSPESQRGPLVVANPDFDAIGEKGAKLPDDTDDGSLPTLSRLHFTPLPGTAEEARVIQGVLPKPSVYVEEVATESELKRSAAPKVLHVATHGFFLDAEGIPVVGKKRGLELDGQKNPPANGRKPVKIHNPMFLSALALAGANVRKGQMDDGILTAFEVSALNLAGTELVVLSACETGLGSVVAREGIMGLRRALVVAGSATQVMSLWQVDDQATRDLMTAYYRKLFREGKGRGEALREAQLEMLQRTDQEHPFYWASFIVSGDWGPLSGVERSEDGTSGRLPPGGARGCGCEVGGSLASESAGVFSIVGLTLLAARRRRRSKRQQPVSNR